MSRVTVYHLTAARRLPLIEEDGLRTRADLSAMLGPIDAFDLAAPGTFARGRRVSGWLSEEYARSQVGIFGVGLVSYTVDPAKALATRAADRVSHPQEYWASGQRLADRLADGDVPDDLEVHQSVPVRAKHVRIHAPLLGDADLGDYAPIVREIADADRLSAKALMHLLIIASEGDFDSVEFACACALAWRDEPDPGNLMRELVETDPDKVVSATLAAYGAAAPEVASRLRAVLEATREWAAEAGLEPGPGLMERSAAVLARLERPR